MRGEALRRLPLRCVGAVEVDLDTKLVTIDGCDLDEAALTAAIDEARRPTRRPSECNRSDGRSEL